MIKSFLQSEFKNGNLGKFKNINEKLTNIKYIKFQNNSIKTPLPSKISHSEYYLYNNENTGEMDDSGAKLILMLVTLEII